MSLISRINNSNKIKINPEKTLTVSMKSTKVMSHLTWRKVEDIRTTVKVAVQSRWQTLKWCYTTASGETKRINLSLLCQSKIGGNKTKPINKLLNQTVVKKMGSLIL